MENVAGAKAVKKQNEEWFFTFDGLIKELWISSSVSRSCSLDSNWGTISGKMQRLPPVFTPLDE